MSGGVFTIICRDKKYEGRDPVYVTILKDEIGELKNKLNLEKMKNMDNAATILQKDKEITLLENEIKKTQLGFCQLQQKVDEIPGLMKEAEHYKNEYLKLEFSSKKSQLLENRIPLEEDERKNFKDEGIVIEEHEIPSIIKSRIQIKAMNRKWIDCSTAKWLHSTFVNIQYPLNDDMGIKDVADIHCLRFSDPKDLENFIAQRNAFKLKKSFKEEGIVIEDNDVPFIIRHPLEIKVNNEWVDCYGVYYNNHNFYAKYAKYKDSNDVLQIVDPIEICDLRFADPKDLENFIAQRDASKTKKSFKEEGIVIEESDILFIIKRPLEIKINNEWVDCYGIYCNNVYKRAFYAKYKDSNNVLQIINPIEICNLRFSNSEDLEKLLQRNKKSFTEEGIIIDRDEIPWVASKLLQLQMSDDEWVNCAPASYDILNRTVIIPCKVQQLNNKCTDSKISVNIHKLRFADPKDHEKFMQNRIKK
jgi:hypothetical protein